MSNAYSDFTKNNTKKVRKGIEVQTKPIAGKEHLMAANNAGGYSFVLDGWKQLDRFLILGSEKGTYYVSQQKLTKDNASNVINLLKADGKRVVDRVVEVSDKGLAANNDPALFVLALAAADDNADTRSYALSVLPKVARIGTHLFHFAEYVNGLRGWGRALRRAVADWYLDKDADQIAHQVVKYQSRDGWSHRDLLRLAHPKSNEVAKDAAFNWVVKGFDASNEAGKNDNLPTLILAFERAKHVKTSAELVKLINDYRLPREALPTEYLNDPVVWEALLQGMKPEALIRNLGNMSKVGLLTQGSDASRKVIAMLNDENALAKARLHPLKVLLALNTYNRGAGVRGSGTWTPVQKVVDALDGAFYKTFKFVEPTNKPTLLALDVSGSMGWGEISGMVGITPAIASAALAMVTYAIEPESEIVGFSDKLVPIKLSAKMRLDEVIRVIGDVPMGGTDCSQPMIWARQNKLNFDSFSVYTDNETWAGRNHPATELKNYRQAMGRAARLAVVGMTATNFTIADPTDTGMFDVAGFDSSTPNVLSNFFNGKF